MGKTRGIGAKKAVNVSGRRREREGRRSAGIYCKNKLRWCVFLLIAWLERERSFFVLFILNSNLICSVSQVVAQMRFKSMSKQNSVQSLRQLIQSNTDFTKQRHYKGSFLFCVGITVLDQKNVFWLSPE